MLSSCESSPSVTTTETLDGVRCCRLAGVGGSATGVGGVEGTEV